MNQHDAPRQLSLLPSSAAPVQFRIDAATRRRGLRHIAEIRQQMAERQAERADTAELAEQTSRQPRRPQHPTAA